MFTTRKSALLYGLAVVLFGFGLPSFAADAPSAVAAVYAADDAWVQAYNAGDLDTVVGGYDEHAVLYPPGAAPVHGAAAIRAYFVKDNAEFVKGGLSFSLGAKRDGAVTGNLGWASGTYVVNDKAGRVVDKGWYFSVSHRVGGKWLYVRDSYNSDGPAHGSSNK